MFEYNSKDFEETESSLEEMWNILMDADDNDYIMGAGTSGDDDLIENDCGIAMSHAYSIISAFVMTDSDDEDHRMLLINDPYGESNYDWHWNPDDSDWTDELVD